MRDLDRPDLAPGGVQWVRVHWCDHANVMGAKAAHVGLIDPDAGLAAAQMALPVMFDSLAPGNSPGPAAPARQRGGAGAGRLTTRTSPAAA